MSEVPWEERAALMRELQDAKDALNRAIDRVQTGDPLPSQTTQIIMKAKESLVQYSIRVPQPIADRCKVECVRAFGADWCQAYGQPCLELGS